MVIKPPGIAGELKRPSRVGFRPNFWGSDSNLRHLAEERVARVENQAAPVLRKISAEGVLPSRGAPSWLALIMFAALHVWRNPAGKRRVLDIQRQSLARQRSRLAAELPDEAIDGFLEEVSSDAFRAQLMLNDLAKVASVMGSMHWILIEFDDLLLATGDHPVTIVPLVATGRPVLVKPLPDSPLLECEEIRWAISPRHALLMTWQDEPDDTERTVRGDFALAAQLNRAVIAQADREWFHHPDRRPSITVPPFLDDRICRPIGRALLSYYGYDAAVASTRRRDTTDNLSALIEGNIDDEIRVVGQRRVA